MSSQRVYPGGFLTAWERAGIKLTGSFPLERLGLKQTLTPQPSLWPLPPPSVPEPLLMNRTSEVNGPKQWWVFQALHLRLLINTRHSIKRWRCGSSLILLISLSCIPLFIHQTSIECFILYLFLFVCLCYFVFCFLIRNLKSREVKVAGNIRNRICCTCACSVYPGLQSTTQCSPRHTHSNPPSQW